MFFVSAFLRKLGSIIRFPLVLINSLFDYHFSASRGRSFSRGLGRSVVTRGRSGLASGTSCLASPRRSSFLSLMSRFEVQPAVTCLLFTRLSLRIPIQLRPSGRLSPASPARRTPCPGLQSLTGWRFTTPSRLQPAFASPFSG